MRGVSTPTVLFFRIKQSIPLPAHGTGNIVTTKIFAPANHSLFRMLYCRIFLDVTVQFSDNVDIAVLVYFRRAESVDNSFSRRATSFAKGWYLYTRLIRVGEHSSVAFRVPLSGVCYAGNTQHRRVLRPRMLFLVVSKKQRTS